MRTGWTVGAGLEYGITKNWSAKIEYDYLGFRLANLKFSYAFAAGLQHKRQSQCQEVKVRHQFPLWRTITHASRSNRAGQFSVDFEIAGLASLRRDSLAIIDKRGLARHDRARYRGAKRVFHPTSEANRRVSVGDGPARRNHRACRVSRRPCIRLATRQAGGFDRRIGVAGLISACSRSISMSGCCFSVTALRVTAPRASSRSGIRRHGRIISYEGLMWPASIAVVAA